MKDKTTIVIKKEIRDKLKVYMMMNDNYDDIIQKLIKIYEYIYYSDVDMSPKIEKDLAGLK